MGTKGRQKLYQWCVNTYLLESLDDFADEYRSGTINYCSTQEGHKHTLIIYIYASTQISKGLLQTLSALRIIHARHLTKTQFLLTCDVFRNALAMAAATLLSCVPLIKASQKKHLAKHCPQEELLWGPRSFNETDRRGLAVVKY